MKRKYGPLAVLLIGAAATAGCGNAGATGGDERGSAAVEVCRDHGGVVAFEDDVVICRDQEFFQVED
jgi:hypothetical protein